MTFFAAISLVGSVLGGVGPKGQACNNCAAAYGLEATSASTATLPRAACHTARGICSAIANCSQISHVNDKIDRAPRGSEREKEHGERERQ